MRQLLLLAALLLPAASYASTITYTVSATASGSFAGSHFSNALVTLTGNADSSSISQAGALYKAALSGATVTVAGLGSSTFTDSMSVAVNQTSTIASINDETTGYGILGILTSDFSTYDLQSDVTKTAVAVGSSYKNFSTARGTFTLSDYSGTATFTASGSGTTFVPQTPGGGTPLSATPEPSTLALLGTGLSVLATFARRRLLRA